MWKRKSLFTLFIPVCLDSVLCQCWRLATVSKALLVTLPYLVNLLVQVEMRVRKMPELVQSRVRYNEELI